MATNIYNYDGTLLTTIADGSIDSESASIRFPGRGYVNYGGPVNENLLWVMQNFARPVPPSDPVNGQTWYDSDNKILKVYDATTLSWASVGGVIVSTSPPISGSNPGSFWYNPAKSQLYVWTGTAWLLIGPLGASDGVDPLTPATPAYSQIDAARLSDGTSQHSVWRIVVGGTILAIVSKDSAFVPVPAIPGFASIKPGININTDIAGASFSGDSTLYRTTQDNAPINNGVQNLGTASFRYASVFANIFNGVATSARYADLAERYESDRSYIPGTLVRLGGEKEITATSARGDDNVFGVISTSPAHLMNSDAGTNETHPPVALAGRVPCMVSGRVSKGQRLMSSSVEGVACPWEESFGVLSVVGRALVDKGTDGVETIEIVVGKN